MDADMDVYTCMTEGRERVRWEVRLWLIGHGGEQEGKVPYKVVLICWVFFPKKIFIIQNLFFFTTFESEVCLCFLFGGTPSPGTFKEVQNCPSLKEFSCNSFKLRCNFQVHLWFNILTWFGVHKLRSHFCTSFSRWIAVTYFSNRKLRCDRRKFQDWGHPVQVKSNHYNSYATNSK